MSEFDNIECASRTDVGVRRSHNQDAHVVMPATDPEQWQQRGHVFLVADGMGAHAVGELASKMAVDNIPHIYSKHATEGAVPALRKAFVEANVTIHTRGRQNREFQGMGTTASALVLRPEGAWIGHVGDSRVYRIRGGAIEQLSFDHSLVWELARRQQKRPEEMQGIPPNVIVRSLGPEPLVQVDVEGPHEVQPGDCYLLCSDGLSGQVTDREIGAVVSALSADEACRFLIHLANLQGGPDNITVIVARVPGTPLADVNGATKVVPTHALRSWSRPDSQQLAALLRRVPWAFLLLGLGIVLGMLAVMLIAEQARGYFLVFILSGLALFGGLIGLMVQNFRETHPVVEEEEGAHAASVYRHASCAIDAPLVQRLAHATRQLDEDLREKAWEFDPGPYREQLGQAQRARAEGRLRDAFAAYCRAFIALADVIHKRRGGGGESFRPVWDRPPPG